MRSCVVVAAGIVTALLAAGCSVSIGATPEGTAEAAIEGELAEVIGLELSGASCDDAASDEPGETFTCEATAAGGEVVTIDAIIEEDDRVFVAASNVIIAGDIEGVEQDAIGFLAPEVGLPPERLAVDCPAGPVVLDGDLMLCEISDTETGERFVLEARLSGYVLREGYADRNYLVGAPIE